MRVTFLFSLALLMSMVGTAFGASDLDARIAEFKKLQSRVEKECIKNPNAKNYQVEIDGKKLKCQDLIVITNQLRIEIDKEVAELKACEDDSKSAHKDLAVDASKIIEKTPACKPSADQKQCLSKFACATMAAATPMKVAMEMAGKAFNSAVLKECSGQSNSCLLNVLRGIFDSIWTSLTAIWDIGKLAITKTGQLLGLVKQSEAETSERAMAAQQASPGFLKKLTTDPVGTVKTMAKNLYQSLEEAAMNHYGCEKWAGIPFRSKCLAPMSTWNCASCAQKAQVFCGIAGYATGEIATALLTGGLVAGGKAVIVGSMKIAAGPAKNVAAFMSKTFPKATAVTTKVGQKIGSVAKTTLTLAERKSVDVWQRVANSQSVEAISKAASTVSKSAVGKIVGTGLKPINAYLSAMDKAFRLGYNSVDKIATRSTQVSQKVVAGSKIADEAMGVKHPTIKVAKDQSKATPGLVVVEPSKSSQAAKITSVQPVQTSAPKLAPPTAAKTSTTSATASKSVSSPEVATANLFDDGFDVTAQIGKYKTDPEYSKLFAGKKPYDEYHDDVAAVITTLERTKPNLTKAEIRKSIESMMNSCDL